MYNKHSTQDLGLVDS